jgi:nucleoside-diphosphate-sugar epimerase
MKTVAITGAGGFIGTELCALFESHGVQVLRLMRNPKPGLASIAWTLGDPLPKACETADAVVHLATLAYGKSSEMKTAAAADLAGTQVLLDSMRAARQSANRPRFIFMSSQSARPDAPNAYGRGKWQIEKILNRSDEIAVRPGLVYADTPASVFGLFERLAGLPIVPTVKTIAAIQPIHVRELAQCILTISGMDAPAPLFELGAVAPMTFEAAIRATALRAQRRVPTMIPVPISLLRLAAYAVDGLFRPEPSIAERLEGLVGLRPMITAPSLEALGCELKQFLSYRVTYN